MKYSLLFMFLSFPFLAIAQPALRIQPAKPGVPAAGWCRIHIPDIGTVDLAPELEIQAGKFKSNRRVLSREISQVLNLYIPEPQFVLQPRGLNEFKAEAKSKYARVIVNSEFGKHDDFFTMNEIVRLPHDFMKVWDSELKAEVEEGINALNMRLVSWESVRVKWVNKMPAIRYAYKRQLSGQPLVYVEVLRFYNSNSLVSFTFSYRESEASIWKPILDKTQASIYLSTIF